MADIKLFNINGKVKEYQSGNVTLEKELQTVIENNMETFFGVTFLASEYKTTDGGRMDSIGIDENHCPVIFEYKRSMKENVINQGLFYLNWLLDHKDSFKVLVIEKLGLKEADKIDWTMPRVVCIAGDFTKYDESAIKQMNRNVSLIRYNICYIKFCSNSNRYLQKISLLFSKACLIVIQRNKRTYQRETFYCLQLPQRL